MLPTPSFASFVQQHILERSARGDHATTENLIAQAERAAMRAVRKGACAPAPKDWWLP